MVPLDGDSMLRTSWPGPKLGHHREAEYQLVPDDSIRDKAPLRIVSGKATQVRGSAEIRPNPLIQTKILTITADEMEWNHETGDIKLSGNVRVKLN